jgi:hypothetical protein
MIRNRNKNDLLCAIAILLFVSTCIVFLNIKNLGLPRHNQKHTYIKIDITLAKTELLYPKNAGA